MNTKPQLRLALTVLTLALAAGCTPPEHDKRLAEVNPPPDFAIEFFVHGSSDGSDRRVMRSNYVLEPNRNLRVELGSHQEQDAFPRFYRQLTFAQFESISEIVRKAKLHAEPTSPNASTSGAASNVLIYEVKVTAWGRTNRYRTTPEESPPTAELLAKLVELGGGSTTGAEATP